MIRLEKVSKIYNTGSELNVLREVDLHIGEKEFFGIIGPSGSGKSTLLHIMGLLDRPSRGVYYFDDRRVDLLDDDELSRLRGESIGFVFQSFYLVPHLSTLENVELPLYYQRVPPAERREIARECLRKVSMNHREHHLPSQMSGGECQRTAIARALVADPKIIMADEPTGNLDSKTGKEIFKIFQDLHEQGRTVVVITHDPMIAQQIPSIVRIQDGEILEENGATS